MALQVFYDGKEKDTYETYFSALKTTFNVSDNFTLKLIGSAYQATEREYFDISAGYFLGNVDSNLGSDNFGDVTITQGVGEQLDHARNDLNAVIANVELKGFHELKDSNTQIEWGFKYTREDIRDRLSEYQVIDSAGFSLNPPILNDIRNQPYEPYVGPLVPFQNIRATNYTKIDRYQAYAQWSRKGHLGESEIWLNAGVRTHTWIVSDRLNQGGNYQTVISPRAQIALKPKWKRDVVFRLSGGAYDQPPTYRELRDSSGTVQPNVKAQKSIHAVFGGDYSFKIGDRGFKFTSEAYYKSMTDVNTYTIDNVRIRYRANNNAEAYAYGLDLRLNGEFVKGTESWF